MSIESTKITLAHGERYGRLTVLERISSKKRGPMYRCGCVCGNSRELFRAGRLMSGRDTECNMCKKGKTA